jgi:hypothetical protein
MIAEQFSHVRQMSSRIHEPCLKVPDSISSFEPHWEQEVVAMVGASVRRACG